MYITIEEFLKKHPGKKYRLDFYWLSWCPKCYREKKEKDEEYSSITFTDYDRDQYDWAFDLLIRETDVKENVIEYIEEEGEEPGICEECQEKEWKEWEEEIKKED